MTWLHGVDHFLVHDDRPAAGDDTPPGVTVDRRGFLSWAGVAWLAAALAGRPRAQESRPAAESRPAGLTFEQVLDQAWPVAQTLPKAGAGEEDAYLFQLAGLLGRATTPAPREPGRAQPGRREWHSRRLASRAGTPRVPPSIAVLEMTMDPEAAIPFHDHRQYNGVILVLAGEVRCRNFDLVEGQADAREVTIRETSDARLVAGRISTLARHRDNIHDLRTGATGARLLDVFTYLGPSGRSVYLDVDEAAPVDKERRIYKARWQR